MAIKVTKVADVVNQHVILCGHSKRHYLIHSILNTLPAVPEGDLRSAWTIRITIGHGQGPTEIALPLPPFLSDLRLSQSFREPILIGNDRLVFFRNRLLLPDRVPQSSTDLEEVVLRAKKLVYDEDASLAGLREQVANVEAALEYRKTGPKRNPIPDDVKLLVWTRDGGACIRCRSKTNLHFDHVIPVAKGGGNSPENLQILCATCNLKKSDKITG